MFTTRASLLNYTPSTRRLYYYVINVSDVIELFGLFIPEGCWKSRSMSTLGGRKEGKKEGKGNVLFNDALNTFILFTVIWRQTYGKGPLR